MSSPILLTDDDDSFDRPEHSGSKHLANSHETISLISGEDTENYFTSDDERDLPAVNFESKKSAIIKKLFPIANTKSNNPKTDTSKPSTSKTNVEIPHFLSSNLPEVPSFEKMIGGVKVHLPVDPYGSQVVLMYKLITAINKGQNCLLESPTGSGKTLALLCAALAWQSQERIRIAQCQAELYYSHHPELSDVDGVVDHVASSPNSKNVSPEKLFQKKVLGKSIYDWPEHDAATDGINKRQEPLQDSFEDSPSKSKVSLHKKRRITGASSFVECSNTASPVLPSTPEKPINAPQTDTPQNARLPTIYYGARTHKQLQQVIKEFRRTSYCGQAMMTVLSSREYSCIREFDKQMWGTKNDMCKGCTKVYTSKDKGVQQTNCNFFDNRVALSHETLPPAFDLEDLVTAGRDLKACPFYAARAMAQKAQIVFCPYNYLIEPGIRSSLQIDLRDNIVVIDEAHNIEDICRDSATFTVTRDNVTAAIKELEVVVGYRYANQDVLSYIDQLLLALKNWDYWFGNQMPLVNNKPVTNNEAAHVWEVELFVETLNNHNIGSLQYHEFQQCAEIFCRRYRETPDALYGVTQATATLLEAMDTVLGYLFRDEGRFKDDFKPVLIRTVYGVDGLSETRSRRNSQFNMNTDKESLSLRLLCMNPAIVFGGLKTAKCIVLASGTLTPLISLHSELDTEFPLQVSPNHVISSDRVWIGTLTTCPNGRPLECKSKSTDQPDIQDALGQAVLWVCQVTPHGVLCFLPSYMLLNKLYKRWQETGLWHQLNDSKHVFMESRNVRDHNDIMEDYYKYVSTEKGALLFAVYRGKVSEGMDFKDHQARAVITVGVPYPNTFDMAVKEKMKYNDKYAAERKLLSSQEWLRVQAYRALNQAVGRCVRHQHDWGAVLLVDARFTQPYYTEHLSKWVKNMLGNNHHTFESLLHSPNSLESFMQSMAIRENEDV